MSRWGIRGEGEGERHAAREEVFESDGGGGGAGRDEEAERAAFASYRSGLMRSEHINSSRFDASHAFEVFAGKSFFSSSTARTHFEGGEVGSFNRGTSRCSVESPASRLARIRSELTELVEDLEGLERGEDDTFWHNVQEEAKVLSDTLGEVANHPYFQVAKSKSTTNLNDLRKVLNGLRSSFSSSGGTSRAPALVSSAPSSLAGGYSQRGDYDTNDYQHLEKRLAALERIIGDSSSSEFVTPQSIINRSSISMSNSLPIVETLSRLEKKISLLDANSLDLIKGKASKLKDELDKVSKTRQTITDASMIDAIKRVDELSTTVSKVEPIADVLPTVILRLKTLEKVHSQSVNFLNRLQEAESEVASTRDNIRQNQTLLQNMRQGFAENIEIMHRNISNVESKILQSNRR